MCSRSERSTRRHSAPSAATATRVRATGTCCRLLVLAALRCYAEPARRLSAAPTCSAAILLASTPPPLPPLLACATPAEAPNQIVFCERCDVAVHQHCYGIATVPDGEWLCEPCREYEEAQLAQGVPPVRARGRSRPLRGSIWCPGLRHATRRHWAWRCYPPLSHLLPADAKSAHLNHMVQ